MSSSLSYYYCSYIYSRLYTSICSQFERYYNVYSWNNDYYRSIYIRGY